MTTVVERRPVGTMLREWRERRRLSQLQLAVEADVSTRHLSFVETGRSRPTSDMILRLSEHLDVPLRERNRLLLAGGFAPAYPEHPMDAPELTAVRAALRQVLAGHEPYPAVVVDRRWNLVDGNAAVPLLIAGAARELLAPPINVLRLSLHPDGMAPRIANLAEWRGHVLARLRRQAAATGDDALRELHDELRAHPGGELDHEPGRGEIAVPLRLRLDDGAPAGHGRNGSGGRDGFDGRDGSGDGDGSGSRDGSGGGAGGRVLSFVSTTAVFGTPLDVTLAELAIESFYPADDATAEFLRSDAVARQSVDRT